MSLSDLASLGSFVSGLAVLASLVFLFFQMKQMTQQVRQAEKNQQAAIRQGRTAILTDLNMRVVEGPIDVWGPVFEGNLPTSLTQLRQFMQIAHAMFQIYEEEFDQHGMGLVSDSAFASFVRNVKRNMRMPGIRVAWKRLRERYGDTFAGFVDEIVAQTPPSTPVTDSLEGWSADIAAELAKA